MGSLDPLVGRFILYTPLAAIAIVILLGVSKVIGWLVQWLLARAYPMKQAREDLHDSYKAKR